MNSVDLYNFFEVGLWLVMSIMVGVLCYQEQNHFRKKLLAIGAVLFVAFAGSDAVEFHTGAWWRPWWLLCWKGICLFGLIGVGITYWYSQRKRA